MPEFSAHIRSHKQARSWRLSERQRKYHESIATTTRRAFGPHCKHQVFAIPQVIDDYNHYMNGVDQADQLCASYPTQLNAQHNWLPGPLFYWPLDTSIVNSFILFRLLHPQAWHRAFRTELVQSLYTRASDPTNLKMPTHYAKKTTTVYATKHYKGLPPPAQEGDHRLKHLPPGKRLPCIFCLFKEEKSGQIRYSCFACDVALCQFDCFESYHAQ